MLQNRYSYSQVEVSVGFLAKIVRISSLAIRQQHIVSLIESGDEKNGCGNDEKSICGGKCKAGVEK